jgi:sulfite exporter TauE/SafE
MTWGARALTLVAAGTLALSGLTLLGLRATRRTAWTEPVAGLLGRVTNTLFTARPAGFPLVIGLLMGLLPCPLVYAGLAVAAASGSAAHGAAVLAGVALGTLPALALVALSGSVLRLPDRQRLARAAGVLLLVAAAFTLARGFGVHAHHRHAPPAPGAAGAESGAPAALHHHH